MQIRASDLMLYTYAHIDDVALGDLLIFDKVNGNAEFVEKYIFKVVAKNFGDYSISLQALDDNLERIRGKQPWKLEFDKFHQNFIYYNDIVNQYVGKKSVTNNKEEKTMSTFETKQFFNGTDVSTMSDSAIFSAIGDLERDIRHLEAIETESKAIEKRINELLGVIANLVEVVDNRNM